MEPAADAADTDAWRARATRPNWRPLRTLAATFGVAEAIWALAALRRWMRASTRGRIG